MFFLIVNTIYHQIQIIVDLSISCMNSFTCLFQLSVAKNKCEKRLHRFGGPEYKGYDLDSDNVETSQKVSNVLVTEEIISRKGLYRESCLIRTSLGPTFVFGIDRCSVHAGYIKYFLH